jgi:carboxylate-amine ligase
VRRIGVEEEFLLLDPEGDAVGVSAPVLARAREVGGDGIAEDELKLQQVEIASDPAADLSALLADLVRRRTVLNAAAADCGAAIAASGTHPLPTVPTTAPEERYQRMVSEFGVFARRELTCATHVHVSVGSRAEGVAVLDRLRPWLPVLTALGANSPFWDGEDTGYAGWRTVLWGQWPSTGPQELFGDEAGYDAAVDEILRAGAMLDPGMVYFDARLSARYPTVEIRAGDACTDVRDSVVLAALCRALVARAAAEADDGIAPAAVRTSLLRAAMWRSARYGMTGELVDARRGELVPAWSLVDELVAYAAPALEDFGDTAYVREQLDRIRESGMCL